MGSALAPGRGQRVDLEHTEIAGAHLIERFRLFFLIALGETVVTTGTAFTDEPFALERLLAPAIAFTGTVALWWCYFQREEVGVEAAEAAEDAGAIGWWGTWTLTLMVLALIAIAVGDEMAIAHPGDDATRGFTILTFGGPALFLLAQIIFLHEALGRPLPRSPWASRRWRSSPSPPLRSRSSRASQRRAPCSPPWRSQTRSPRHRRACRRPDPASPRRHTPRLTTWAAAAASG